MPAVAPPPAPPRPGGQGSGSMDSGTFRARSPRRAADPHRTAAVTSPAGARAQARGRRDQALRRRRDQALRRRLAVPRAAHRSARPRQAQRPPAAGNPPPSPGLRAPPGRTGRLLQLAEPPHPRRVTPRGGRQRRIRDDRAGRSPDSGREILRASGAEQHPRTRAPGRAARLPRHVPDLPAGELPLQLAPALTVPHGPSPPSTLSQHAHPRPSVPAARPAAVALAHARARRPGQPQLTGACPRKPTRTRQALRRAAPGVSDPSPAPPARSGCPRFSKPGTTGKLMTGRFSTTVRQSTVSGVNASGGQAVISVNQ